MGLLAVSTRNPKPHPHPHPNPYPFLQVHSEIASSMPDLQWPKGLGRLPPENHFRAHQLFYHRSVQSGHVLISR